MDRLTTCTIPDPRIPRCGCNRGLNKSGKEVYRADCDGKHNSSPRGRPHGRLIHAVSPESTGRSLLGPTHAPYKKG
jgi:hypothetical protein